MTEHLLLITLGPVQDFIAQARRTRDLWYGSHLLSELGRAAARALVAGGAQLIFPSIPAGDPELEACLAPLRSNGKSPQNIANKLLAQLPKGVEPEQLAKDTREAIATFWRDEIAAPVKEKCARLLASNIDEAWQEQIETFLEFNAAWLPLNDYMETRRGLELSIAGRKLLRDFEPWVHLRKNVRKSSLDGARETVLSAPSRRDIRLVQRYRIADGEQLDAIGLIKRAGGEPDQFVPLTNIALANWLEKANQVAKEELTALEEACREAEISRVSRPDLPCAKQFGFEGSLFFRGRWARVFKELGRDEYEAEEWGRKHVEPLYKKLSEPYPYVACIVADGDLMGRAINALRTIDGHRTFSAALASFANQARTIVEQKYKGALVYAGGDDVLAFVPLLEALDCAEALRRAFEASMAEACGPIKMELRPTLSVGIGIGHVIESMGELLKLGRLAEREAKIDRNSLAILLDKRSGGTLVWREQWPKDPVGRLNQARALQGAQLPSRKVYEIARLLKRLPTPEQTSDSNWAHVLAMEAQRSLSRVDGGAVHPAEVGLNLNSPGNYEKLYEHVDMWVARQLIARVIQMAAIDNAQNQGVAA